jgi:phosphatidylglycerophosphatase A
VAERVLGRSDPGQVVIDEVVGLLLTLALIPVGVRGALVGFALFRVFDIIKPFPCARLEKLGGGVGIMADDVMAGLRQRVPARPAVARTVARLSPP